MLKAKTQERSHFQGKREMGKKKNLTYKSKQQVNLSVLAMPVGGGEKMYPL